MNPERSNDPLYKVGTIIKARVNPDLKLIIDCYKKRIYYCAVLGEPERKHFAYFESELLPAATDTMG